ncbi:hypothetical protein J3A64_001780 [Pseudarthrobacter sp. PvP004]|nr:hypothetical protein [Pseudarthrobacter sp. PvP004]
MACDFKTSLLEREELGFAVHILVAVIHECCRARPQKGTGLSANNMWETLIVADKVARVVHEDTAHVESGQEILYEGVKNHQPLMAYVQPLSSAICLVVVLIYGC